MTSNWEGRLVRLEKLIGSFLAQFLTIGQRLQDLEQASRVTTGGGGGYGPAGVGGPFWCRSPGFAAGGGSWPALTCSTGSADVYQDQSGSLVLYQAGATVRWWYHDASTAGRLVAVFPTVDGAWQAVVDSCTGV